MTFRVHRGVAPRFLVALALALSACSSSDSSRCESDSDCTAAGTRCDTTLNQCVCATDDACEDGEFCNRAGVCQEKAGCERNSDCPDNAFCDISTGACLEGQALVDASNCSLASHCALGQICVGGTCQPGCFDAGDCPVGEICREGQCLGGFGICDEDINCEFGQTCDVAAQQCVDDRRGPYCRRCTQRTLANPEPCDDSRNFCLINNRELGGFTDFCGVDCSLGQPCPNGYGCNQVVILTQTTCTSQAQCQCNGPLRFATTTCTVAVACDPRLPDGTPDPSRPPCRFEGEPACNDGVAGGEATCIVPAGQTVGDCTCRNDADCGGDICTSGLCCGGSARLDRECRGGEGTTSGFCTCSTDDDCPNNSCDGSRGACSLTGLPCTPGNNDCDPVPCINNGCVVGRNCVPAQGLACSDVLGQ